MRNHLRPLTLCLAALLTALLAGCANPTPNKDEQRPQQTMRAAAQAQEGGIALDWQPPQDRTDGSSLSSQDIAGYRVYVGAEPGRHETVMDVMDPKQTNVIVGGLEPDREYYIAITTVDQLGQESPKSREVREVAKPLEEVQTAVEEHQRKERRG